MEGSTKTLVTLQMFCGKLIGIEIVTAFNCESAAKHCDTQCVYIVCATSETARRDHTPPRGSWRKRPQTLQQSTIYSGRRIPTRYPHAVAARLRCWRAWYTHMWRRTRSRTHRPWAGLGREYLIFILCSRANGSVQSKSVLVRFTVRT